MKDRRIRNAAIASLAAIVASALTWAGATDPATGKRPAAADGSKYHLTIDNFNRLLKAKSNLAALAASDPRLMGELTMNAKNRGPADRVRRIEESPKVAEAIRSAGFTPQEYLSTADVLVRAYKVALDRKSGKNLDTGVPREDVLFVETHMDEIQAMLKGPRLITQPRSGNPNTTEDIYSAAEPEPELAPEPLPEPK